MTGIVHRSDLHENATREHSPPVDNYANRDYGDKALRAINHDSQNGDTQKRIKHRIGNEGKISSLIE